MPLARLSYVVWEPEFVTITRSGGGQILREPALAVVGSDGRLIAVGREAPEIAHTSGNKLLAFPSVAIAWEHRSAAGRFLYFLLKVVVFARLPSWEEWLIHFLPWLRPTVVVHLRGGAEDGLTAERAEWLRSLFPYAGTRRTFVWTGEVLEPDLYLADTPGRGTWHGPAPRLGTS